MTSSILLTLASASAGPPFWVSMLPIVGMFGIFWFLILRPQMRQQKERANKLAAIKKGDSVLTGGGLVAKVVKVDEHYVDLELAPGMKVKAVKSTLADVIPPGGAAPAND
jgi:preprotein translocase subunit YajC